MNELFGREKWRAIVKICVFFIAPMSWQQLAGQDQAASKINAESFWEAADPIGHDLPADKFYPAGRRFLFSGFAGVPERDKASGFSALGPVYGNPREFLDAAKRLGIPIIYPIGMDKVVVHSWGNGEIPEVEIRAQISKQVSEVAGENSIVWWYLLPEELRYWNTNELRYLELACETIRQIDPLGRPIWMYEPNHRSAESLVNTGKYLDIVGKGCYTNYSGYKQDRVWVRWSMEQETDAIAAIGRTHTPIVVPELFEDAEPSDRRRIAHWVRHDVVLGLIHGAKGVVVFSLFKRPEVANCFGEYYDAYTSMARELLQHRKLGEVFLFGQERKDLIVSQVSGPSVVTFADPESKVESRSLTERENEQIPMHSYPAISSREYAYGNKRFLFLCNSSYDENVEVKITGFPENSTLVTEAFTFNFLHPRVRDGALHDTIPGLGVRCYVFSEFSPVGR